ncbi:MAG: hypothetical protein IIC24_07630 [Chloroflexi bacterium]|nr:hypothetical protein [Chloroflexota bacterium]
MALAFEKCVACRPGSPEITDLEISDLMPQIPKWRLVQDSGARKLERQFERRTLVGVESWAADEWHR